MDPRRPVLVSVILPTFNRAHLVGRALRSVLAQTMEDFEILVVDDGSTDGTADALAAVADSRIRILRQQGNLGVGRARNTALPLTRGPWVAFLDDDNEWAPTYLERLLEIAVARPDAEVIYCRAQRRAHRTGRDVGLVPPVVRDGAVFCDLVRGWKPAMSATMVRRSRLLTVGGFDEQLPVAEDWDLCFRLARQTAFAGTAEALMIRHESVGERLSDRPELYAVAVPILERRWGGVIADTCGRAAHRRWRAGLLTYLELCRARSAVESGRRLAAVRHAGRMVPLLPWSAASFTRALAFTAFGPRRYGILTALGKSRVER